MKINRNLDIRDFSYDLPPELIAQYPAEERDASRLVVYRDGIIQDKLFRNIDEFIPERSMMVFNNTRVVRARLIFSRPTGATIEIFCLEPAGKQRELQKAFSQTGSAEWVCLVGNVKRWKEGNLVKKFQIDDQDFLLSAFLQERLDDGCFLIRFEWKPEDETFSSILEKAGLIPLPPYIDRASGVNDQVRYQTIFAEDEGSVAAPTAGLHFTEPILQKLHQKEIQTEKVTLHVGLGTFRPVSAAKISGHTMHSEKISVTRKTLQALASNTNPLVAVGTTSVRTLESLYWAGVRASRGEDPYAGISQWEAYDRDSDLPADQSLQILLETLNREGREEFISETSLMIIPGYKFRLTDVLVTNFHQPQSTLLLLVAAFTGNEWKDVYKFAIEKRYRFLSYGDACLFFRKNKD